MIVIFVVLLILAISRIDFFFVSAVGIDKANGKADIQRKLVAIVAQGAQERGDVLIGCTASFSRALVASCGSTKGLGCQLACLCPHLFKVVVRSLCGRLGCVGSLGGACCPGLGSVEPLL